MVARPLQGPHSNHHPASAVPDRAVTLAANAKTGASGGTTAAGANPISKAHLATGAAQPTDTRDTGVGIKFSQIANQTPAQQTNVKP